MDLTVAVAAGTEVVRRGLEAMLGALVRGHLGPARTVVALSRDR
jgi:hypothetical protein